MRADSKMLLLVLTGLIVGSASEPSTSPITYRHEIRHHPRLHLHIVTIDLTDPRVKVQAFAGGDDPDAQGPWQTTLMSVLDIAERERVDVAVNANFFSSRQTLTIAGRKVPYFRGNWARVSGWLMCNGKLISAEPSHASLVVLQDGQIQVGKFEKLPDNARHIVSGSQLLLQNGKLTARGDVRAPRTAVGIDREAKLLTMLVVDGRLQEHSVGLSEVELARELLALGCSEALNLDGGGSSTLVMRDERTGNLQVINRPSDGHDLQFPLSLPRNVACVLGITLEQK